MRTETSFAVLVFFSLLSFIATLILNGTLLSKTNAILSKLAKFEEESN